jgi:hypothetical protein
MDWMFDNAGRLIAWLQKPANQCEPSAPNDSTALRDTLRPGDVLLVEGKGRISGSIKYLTQSTWSHSALYVGPMAGAATITVGNATRLGASQRSTTRRCASHHIATQRANRWGHPAALVRLARTVILKRLGLRDGHVQRAHSLSPNHGWNASPICPDLIYDRHSQEKRSSGLGPQRISVNESL